MTLIDTLTILLTILGVIVGVKRGLINQMSSLAGIALGVIGGKMFGSTAVEIIKTLIPNHVNWPASSITTVAVAHIALFIVIYLTVRIVAYFLKSITRTLNLGMLDRSAGGMLCVVKYMFFFSILLNIYWVYDPKSVEFTSHHMMNDKPFVMTMNLAPMVLGSEVRPGNAVIESFENSNEVPTDSVETNLADRSLTKYNHEDVSLASK